MALVDRAVPGMLHTVARTVAMVFLVVARTVARVFPAVAPTVAHPCLVVARMVALAPSTALLSTARMVVLAGMVVGGTVAVMGTGTGSLVAVTGALVVPVVAVTGGLVDVAVSTRLLMLTTMAMEIAPGHLGKCGALAGVEPMVDLGAGSGREFHDRLLGLLLGLLLLLGSFHLLLVLLGVASVLGGGDGFPDLATLFSTEGLLDGRGHHGGGIGFVLDEFGLICDEVVLKVIRKVSRDDGTDDCKQSERKSYAGFHPRDAHTMIPH